MDNVLKTSRQIINSPTDILTLDLITKIVDSMSIYSQFFTASILLWATFLSFGARNRVLGSNISYFFSYVVAQD